MARRRTRYSLENARLYLTGTDVESAARAALLLRGFHAGAADRIAARMRGCFERACSPTIDPHDRAHDKIDPASRYAELMPGAAVEGARPRRYPRACLSEVMVVMFGRLVGRGLVSIDSECESIGDRAARLAAAGVPVGYMGSVTGAQQQRAKGPRDVPALETAGRIAKERGSSLRDLTRPMTRQLLTPEERALTSRANAILREANRADLVESTRGDLE